MSQQQGPSRFHWRRLPAYALLGLRGVAFAGAVYVSLQFSDDALCALINACLMLLPFGLLFALSGRWVFSASTAALLALFLYELGEIKHKYFANRLALSDYVFLIEPANWRIVQQYPLLQQAAFAFVVLLALLAFDAWRGEKKRTPAGRSWRLASLAMSLALMAVCWNSRHHHEWAVFEDDAECGDAHRCGIMARLVYSVAVFEFAPPAHAGDPAVFLQQKAQLPEQPKAAATRPDVVLWLNESTFDPRNWRLPNATLPRLRMFDRNERTRAGSLMRVHTFGGKTWLSEFSVLSGLVPDDFGARRNQVFNAVSPNLNSSLVRLFKENGYRTVVLMPTFKRFYGAGRTYEALGFDQVLTLRDFHEYDSLRGDEWDIADSERLSEAARNIVSRHRNGRDGQKPLFLYLLSIKEHAPYSKDKPAAYNLTKAGLPKDSAPKLTDYIGRLRLLDSAVMSLDTYLSAPGSRPALFAWFGDHQPYFEGPSPPYRFELPEPKNVTQFQLRTNYPTPEAPLTPMMDIAFLPGLIADFANLDRDEYFEALSAMRRLCAGVMDECGNAELLTSYKAYLFGPGLALFADD